MAGQDAQYHQEAHHMVLDLSNGQATEVVGSSGPNRVVITPPRFQTVRLILRGTSPYVGCRFSKKAQEAMIERMEQGSTAKTARGNRQPRDFKADFREAVHVSEDGWYGIPASAFRNAAIDVCRVAGYAMTKAKMSVFIRPDGLDRVEGSPLVRLIGGEPEQWQTPVRNKGGVADIRVRPRWREWSVVIVVDFDSDQFKMSDIVNLFNRVGRQVGIGEGRPYSKDSNGLGFGLFEIENAPETMAEEHVHADV
jgi:hypothetical protein